MKYLYGIVAVAALMATASPALAVDVQCTEHSTTFIYKSADFEVLPAGERRDGGVGNKVHAGFEQGCIMRLKERAMMSAAGLVRVDVVQSSNWEGVVDPTGPNGPNRILFKLDTSFGRDFEQYNYRLGHMKQTVHWTDATGRYYVDAVSRPAPIATPEYESPAVDAIDVQLCEIVGGVDVVVKEVRVTTNLHEPELCGS